MAAHRIMPISIMGTETTAAAFLISTLQHLTDKLQFIGVLRTPNAGGKVAGTFETIKSYVETLDDGDLPTVAFALHQPFGPRMLFTIERALRASGITERRCWNPLYTFAPPFADEGKTPEQTLLSKPALVVDEAARLIYELGMLEAVTA
jgi:hypothetical protein